MDPREPPPDPRQCPAGHVRIAVAALLRAAGGGTEVLIARRPRAAIRGGLWEFPGGKALPGEDPAVAAARELAEETGVMVRASDGKVLGCVRHTDRSLRDEASIELTLVAFAAGPDASPRPLAATECRWERIDRLERHEWPAANAELNRMLAEHVAAR
jgi:mutator protein MutT